MSQNRESLGEMEAICEVASLAVPIVRAVGGRFNRCVIFSVLVFIKASLRIIIVLGACGGERILVSDDKSLVTSMSFGGLKGVLWSLVSTFMVVRDGSGLGVWCQPN